MTQPARGYRWAPFAPGHELSVKHGARSPRLVARRATEMVEQGDLPTFVQLVEGPLPWLRDGDAWAVTSWQRSEARVTLVQEYLDTVGVVDAEGRLRESTFALLARMERAAADCRDRLGLDPTSRVRLLRDTASAAHSHAATSALEKVAAAGRATRKARQEAERAQIAQLPPGGAPTAENGPQVPEIGDPERADDQEANDD